MAEVLRWSQTVIDLADGDPTKGQLHLRFAAGGRVGIARHRPMGAGPSRVARRPRPGGRHGPQHRPDVACPRHHVSYGLAIAGGVLLADDAALRDIEEALQIAERSSDDFALGYARSTLGVALVHRDSPAERERGLAVLGQVRDMCLHGRFYLSELPAVDVWTARERARRGDRDGAIPQMRAAIDDLFRAGQLGYCIPATGVLVETLLERGAGGDVAEAEAAIDRLAAAQPTRVW